MSCGFCKNCLFHDKNEEEYYRHSKRVELKFDWPIVETDDWCSEFEPKEQE